MRKNGKNRQPLTDLFVRRPTKLNKPKRYADGRGLYLAVQPTGAKSWLFIGDLGGKRYTVGLGSAHDVTLEKARELAGDIRAKKRQGIAPVTAREQSAIAKAQVEAKKAESVTLQHAARDLHKTLRGSWRNAKHDNEWIVSLERYCGPILQKPVSQITPDDVLKVLLPIWADKQVTAQRVRERIERTLDHAKAKGWRSGDNPAALRGNLSPTLPKRKKTAVKRLPAIEYKYLPQFIADLRQRDGIPALALEFAILTAARTGEVRFAAWDEIDFEAKTWTIAAPRMKAGVEHRVPLSDRAIAILREAEKIRQGQFIFAGTIDGKPFGDREMRKLLARLRGDTTVHGMRATFRTWVAERTNFQRELAEAALAHTIRSEVERSYQRGDLFDKRRKLMEAWAQYCTLRTADNVVQMNRSNPPIPA